MLEVEMKFRVSASGDLIAALQSIGAERQDAIEQVDQYFAHPCRDFGETDEALRIRRVGGSNFVTYKGPKIDATTKTRREIEISLPDGEATATGFAELLAALGFVPVANVRKRRVKYSLTWQSRDIEVALDDVAGLGAFLEIEAIADESELEGARATVSDLAKKLGLQESERRSYLEMLLSESAESLSPG